MSTKTSTPAKARNRSNQVPLAGCSTPIRDQTVEQRLTAINFDVDPITGCWEWRGRLNSDGYGVLSLKRAALHEAKVHRLIYQLVVGRIPAGMVLRHVVCANRMCGRPSHVALGEQADNVRDMFVDGHAHAGHTLLPAGGRYADGSRCATCRQARKVAAIHTEVRRAAPARFTAFADAA
jgi:HNH endonuclease